MPRPRSAPRRPHPEALSPTAGSVAFDVAMLAILFLSLCGTTVLFGGSVFWASGPFLSLAMLAATLCHVRSLKREGAALCVYPPPGTLAWASLLSMALLRAVFVPVIPYQAWTEVIQLASVLLFYIAIADLSNRRKLWRWMLAGFLLLAAIQSMYALSLHWRGSTHVLWLLRPEGYGTRASGTFICPNHFAQLVQMGLVLAVGLLATPGMDIPLRLIAGYTLLAGLPALFLTGSRSGWLGFIAGVSLIALAKAFRKGWKASLAAVVAIPAFMAGLVWVLWQFSPMFRQRLLHAMGRDIRLTAFWPDTWRMIQGEGFWGAGPGVFQHAFEQYRLHFDHAEMYLRYAHNEYLHVVGDYGWLGLVVVVGGLFRITWLLFRAAFRQSNEAQAMIPIMMLAILGAAAVHAVFDYTAHMPANMLALSLAMGTLYGRGLQRGIWEAKPLCSWRAVWLARLAASTAPIMGLAFIPLALGAWSEYRLDGARLAKNTREELLRAREMQRWVPLHWRGWREEALHHRREAFWTVDPELRSQRADRSRVFYDKALRLNPFDRISLLGLVQLEMRENQYATAIPLLEELTVLDPLDAHTRVQLGLALRYVGRFPEALDAFQAAKRLRNKPDRQIDLNIVYLQDLLRESAAK